MDTGVIRIVINENEKIIELLKRMIEIKLSQNKEVECELDGKLLTTKDNNNIQEMLVNNSDIIFESYENDRNILLQTQKMQEVIESFEDRGIDEFDTQEEADLATKQENELDQKVKELNNLDFSNSINVYNWLNSTVDYVNDIKLHIPLDKEDYKYASTANYIVRKLEERGYTTERNQVNNLDDYYRRLISYQLEDLDKYQFFAYDYADDLRDKNILTSEDLQNSVVNNNSETIDENQVLLTKLDERKKEIVMKLNIIDKIEKGLMDRNQMPTISYDETKNNISKQIEELEKDNNTEVDENVVIEESRNATNYVKSIAYNNNFSNDEQMALKAFYNTEIFPENNEFINALNLTLKLPETSIIRDPLKDAIIKLSARYNFNKEEEKEELLSTFEKLGIQIPGKHSAEIEKLKQDYQFVENEQQLAIEVLAPRKEQLEEELAEVEKQIVNINDIKVVEEVVVNEQSIDDNDLKSQEIAEEQASLVDNTKFEEETIDKQPEDNFASKLHEIAEAGPLFVDTERRINEENQWMELNTAKNLGKLDNDDTKEDAVVQSSIIEEPNLENNSELDEFDLVPKDDSLAIPHPIKAIKKAGIKLIEKVRGIEFSKKIQAVLDWIKEHKKVAAAVATGLVIAGTAALSSELGEAKEYDTNSINAETTMSQNTFKSDNEIDNTVQESQDDNKIIQEENSIDSEVQQQTITPEKTDAKLAQEAIQNAINDVMNGEQVYSNVYDAVNNENGLSTSDRQKENSWSNSEATAFYDDSAKVLTREEAEAVIAAGGEVVARFDNDGTPIGYASVGQSLNNDTSGLSK